MALHVCWAFQIGIMLTLLVFIDIIVDKFLVALHLLDLFLWTYSEDGLYLWKLTERKDSYAPQKY